MWAMFEVVKITEKHIDGYREAFGLVAKERKYLARLEPPSLETTPIYWW
jgi:hypothetical protein